MNEKKENVVISRIEDAVVKQDRLYFFDFYDEAMQVKIETFLKKSKAHYILDGGFPDAARAIRCISVRRSGRRNPWRLLRVPLPS